ncbi:hypothetical protein ACFFK0_02590 [Paenibacillus chartarius]|uniref:Salivary secreted peptide n=1 Tax=Paenibacillus chartarius TaxID=747481 RepID=A0ABV6DFC4_9BACL
MSRALHIVLFAATCAIVIYLAAESDPVQGTNGAAKDPNPMKINQEQFNRMQQQPEQFVSR